MVSLKVLTVILLALLLSDFTFAKPKASISISISREHGWGRRGWGRGYNGGWGGNYGGWGGYPNYGGWGWGRKRRGVDGEMMESVKLEKH